MTTAPSFVTGIEKALAEDRNGCVLNRIISQLSHEVRRIEKMILHKDCKQDPNLLEFLEHYHDALVKAGVVCKKVWSLYNTAGRLYR